MLERERKRKWKQVSLQIALDFLSTVKRDTYSLDRLRNERAEEAKIIRSATIYNV